MKQLIPDDVTITHNGEEVTFCLRDIVNQNTPIIPALKDIYSIAMLKIAEELTPDVVKTLSEQLNKTLDDILQIPALLDYPQVQKLESIMDVISYESLLKLQRKFTDKVGKSDDSVQNSLTKLMAEMVYLTIRRRHMLHVIQCQNQEKNITEEIK